MNETEDSKYIQQHLANERTYLAWIRTALAIMGIGFLIVNIHFSTNANMNGRSDQLVEMIGVLSVLIGLIAIIFSTIHYVRKKKQINQQTFTSALHLVWLISALMLVMAGLFFAYFYLY
ncbi:putative membrane protein [Alkalibacillus flavidus]|uniref:Membrane protein n=1 Tax=Alkalibacillus flavidus TaxID=546021 RepID=A0ABV2KW28_9BACI